MAQELLDRPSDVFLKAPVKQPDGKTVDALVGSSAAVNRVLADLPQAGRDIYEQKFGATAAKLLAQARKESDKQLLAEVARRYLLTKAGAEAAADLKKAAKEPPAKPKDWPMVGGNASRSGQGVGDRAFMRARWHYPLFGSDSSGPSGQVKRWIDGDGASVVKRLAAKGEAVIPAFAPLTVTVTDRDGRSKTLIIYRDYEGISTVQLKTGKREWVSRSHWSLEGMLKDGQKGPTLTGWVKEFKDTLDRPQVLIENATLGTVSCDGQRVFLIDDLQVPPLFTEESDSPKEFVRPGVDANKLQAFSVGSGKLYWELGGPKPGPEGADKMTHDFRDTYFLGAPLPLDGKLYFLNEKDREIRLVCLDNGKLPAKDPQPKDLDAAIAWVLPLGTAKEKILIDYRRRIHGSQIAYGDGVLVCPTNCGVLVGVGALTHNLLWAHPYAEEPAKVPVGPPPVRMVPVPATEWKASAPVVQGGKVVFALPDGPELRCLDLYTGRLIWGNKRTDDDVYLGGVFAGRVVVVGKKEVRALNLDDGKTAWRVPTGMPSGRGAASENVFYQPLRGTADKTGPEIVAIDVAKGRAIAHTRSPKDPRTGEPAVPGNIVFAGDTMISQSATELVAFPLLKTTLKRMDELLKKSPKDPRGLYERGELRHGDGNLLGAAEDFRAALANNPPAELRPQVRAELIDALTELLRRDFGADEKYLKECETLIREPAGKATPEDRRRLTSLLATKARGFEGQGKAVDALNAYLELAAVNDDELLTAPDDPALKTRPAAWARDRLAALYAGTKAPSRKLLDEAIGKKGAALRKGKDDAALRAFVALFSPKFAEGREAQLELSERLMKGDKAAQLEAEAWLLKLADQTEDKDKQAQALEALGRLMSRLSKFEDALFYYRRLAQVFPTAVIRGKKGAEYLDDLATDKRFLPYLEKSPPTEARHWKGELSREGDKLFTRSSSPPLYSFFPRGEVLPSLRRLHVAINLSTNRVKLIERSSGEEKMSLPLSIDFQKMLAGLVLPAATVDEARLGCHVVGNVIILALGERVMALDAIGHRLLWDRNLLGAKGAVGRARVGPITLGAVILLNGDGLSAVDLLTGEVIWQRSDVTAASELFGDGERLYVVGRGADGKASGTRAFRTRDGESVAVRDFAAAYDQRVRAVGGELLVAEKGADDLVLRLYDVAAGKDVWSQKFATGSVVMRSHDADLAGALEPTGRATVVSLSRRKVVLAGILNADHMKNLKEAHLLADDQSVYVALDTVDPKRDDSPVESNFRPFSGLRGVPVNGMVYALDRRTSKYKWTNEVLHQMLVLEQFGEMPVLLFTSRYQPGMNGTRRPPSQAFGDVQIQVYDKRTGKLFFARPVKGERPLEGKSNGPIYAINYDPSTGKIELIANNYKLTVAPLQERKP